MSKDPRVKGQELQVIGVLVKELAHFRPQRRIFKAANCMQKLGWIPISECLRFRLMCGFNNPGSENRIPAMRKRNIRQFLARPQDRPEAPDVAMTLFVPRDTAARLKEIAVVENLSLQQLLTRAVEEWLARSPDISGMRAGEPATGLDAPS